MNSTVPPGIEAAEFQRFADTPPLSDPARILRKILAGMVLFQLCIALILLGQGGNPEMSGSQLLSVLASICIQLGIITAILPSRKPDILYLRAFRADGSNEQMRRVLELCARPLRVAGIRDPRRRILPVIKPLLEGVLLWIYSSNRRMNLEANSDWRIRIAASLAEARGAIIDFRHPTESLREELEICRRQLPPERILMIVADDAESPHQLHRVVLKGSGPQDLREFAQTVRQFLGDMTEIEQERKPEATSYAVARSDAGPERIALESTLERRQYVLGWILAIAASVTFGVYFDDLEDGGMVLLIGVSIASLAFPLAYVIESVRRRRLRKRFDLDVAAPPLHPGLFFFLAAFALLAASLYPAARAYGDYNLRARTIELLMGPYSGAKVAYAEFFITNERAPSNEELLAQLGTFEGVRVEMEEGNIVFTVDSPQDPELDGLSFALIPDADPTSINFTCELRSPSMAEYMPKFMCPPRYGY